MKYDLDKLIICERTLLQLRQYLHQPTHSLMLTGETGVGLGAIARSLGSALAGSEVIYLEPTVHRAQKTAIINADDIDYVTRVTRDKRAERLAIIMNDVDQTAPGVFERILKIVEEPVANVNYIFTTHYLPAVPQTILSRTQVVEVGCPSDAKCKQLFNGVDQTKRAQIQFLARRHPAQIYRLIHDEASFRAAADEISRAKRFVTGVTDDRISVISELKERSDAQRFLSLLVKLIDTIHRNGDTERDKVLVQNLDLITATNDRITANGSVKAQLLNLAVCYN